MPWALQSFGDKMVSICPRESTARVSAVVKLPSVKNGQCVAWALLLDGETHGPRALYDGEGASVRGQLGKLREAWAVEVWKK